MSYIGSDGAEHRPVMLHRTILGSIERFIGILIEHYAGAFPYWLAPVQAKIIQVKREFGDYASEVESYLKRIGVRVERDERDEKLGKKIRDAELEKIPYMLVVGEKEIASRSVSVRSRTHGSIGPTPLDGMEALLAGEFSPFRDR
jgi:threonyl-tRNA synthetase